MRISLGSSTLGLALLLSWAQCSSQLLSSGQGSDDEVRLLDSLFKSYNPLIRPVRNIEDTIEVNFSLALSQLINIDEKNQIMKTNVWLQLYWVDYQLMWDTDEYGGIGVIRLPSDKIWTPDIVLFNNADGKYEVSYKSNCVIYADGNINWIPPAIYQSSCTIDVQFFPFDEQNCEMKFGSWTFTGKQLTFNWYNGMNMVDLNDYLKSGTWDIISCPGRIENKTDQNTNEVTKQVVFTMVLRRKTLFYTVNLIIPCVLISFVSVCVFALPADAGEKMTLCISILLALVVFMLLVSKILPPSLRIPLIAKYLLFTFVMNIFAIFITVIIINRNYRTPRTHRMPYWVRLVFLRYLPKILFMERPDHEERWKQREPVVVQPIDHNDTRQYIVNRRTDLMELTEIHHPNCKLNPKAAPPTYEKAVQNHPDEVIPLTPEMHKATESLTFIAQHLRNEEEYDNVREDWKYVALVLDRLHLWIFLTVTIGGTMGIFLQAPHIFEFVDQDMILKNLVASSKST